jgi:uncharacterized coiled-coil protein SlyX
MNSLIQSKRSIALFLILLVLACFPPLQKAHAVVPPPDGGYPGGNTAEGQNALLSLSTGAYNTAVGVFSLLSNSTANFNTAVGAGALLLNTADQNTATGAGALLSTTIGVNNTATGAFALFSNTEGSYNTAAGDQALFSNTTGTVNTAIGAGALTNNTTGARNTAIGGDFVLFSNTTGSFNTAIGVDSLAFNTTGLDNTANGAFALDSNTTGAQNTAVGYAALLSNTTAGANTSGANTAVGAFALQSNTTSGANTAIGYAALGNIMTNGGNTAIGDVAGFNLTGSQNICIGAGVGGISGENNTIRIADNLSDTQGNSACYIGGIYNQLIDPATETLVGIDANGKLGTVASSRRFKRDIKPIDMASEAILALRPVTFHYKTDAKNTPCFGLIAEEVATVSPDLVVRDHKGEIYTVRYDQINAMLLNEFLKEHRTVQEQKGTIEQLKSAVEKQEATNAQQQKQIEALTAGLQKVSAQLEANKPAPQVAENP